MPKRCNWTLISNNMIKQFAYKRQTPSSGCGKEPHCQNCDLSDLFISPREAKSYAADGARAFKNEKGEVMGTSADYTKMFCTRTGTTTRPDNYCKEHIWAKEEWINPDEEMTLC